MRNSCALETLQLSGNRWGKYESTEKEVIVIPEFWGWRERENICSLLPLALALRWGWDTMQLVHVLHVIKEPGGASLGDKPAQRKKYRKGKKVHMSTVNSGKEFV